MNPYLTVDSKLPPWIDQTDAPSRYPPHVEGPVDSHSLFQKSDEVSEVCNHHFLEEKGVRNEWHCCLV